MANFARIINNVAVDVSRSPESHFQESFASEFIEVPDEVRPQWVRDNEGKWSAPAPVVPDVPAVTYPKVGPIAFQMLFTPAEMIAADELKASDKVLASFWKLIDDPRTDVVDLGLESVQNAIAYTLDAVKNHGVDVDVPARLAAILSGVLK